MTQRWFLSATAQPILLKAQSEFRVMLMLFQYHPLVEVDYVPTQEKRRKKLTLRKKRVNPTGRLKDKVWSFFTTGRQKDGNRRPCMNCNFCNQEVSAESARLKKHIEKCTQYRKKTSVVVTEPAPNILEPASVSNPQQRNNVTTPTSLSNFLCRTNKNSKEEIDVSLAKFVFSANIPFQTVENEQFKQLMSKVRPSYVPPTRQEIAGSLLDKVYEEITEEVIHYLCEKEVVVLQDGWSTNKNQPVIAHSLTARNKIFFTNTVSTGTESKTADFCQSLLEKEIQDSEGKYHCKVIGCVTDNCSVMALMRRNMSTKHPDLYFYGCNSHLLNLIGRDMTPSELKTKVVKVQTYFRNHHYESASLAEKHGTRPILPGDTRWNSEIDAFDYFIKNHTK